MPYSYDPAEVRGVVLVAEPPERRAFVLYVLLLLYVLVMRAAPAARRPGIRSHVYVQIRFESGASRACWNSLARADGAESQCVRCAS